MTPSSLIVSLFLPRRPGHVAYLCLFCHQLHMVSAQGQNAWAARSPDKRPTCPPSFPVANLKGSPTSTPRLRTLLWTLPTHLSLRSRMPDYVPPSYPWEMTQVISSLITFSLYLLKPGGRLVFFLPTDNAEYDDVDIPVVDGLQLISNSRQDYGKWSRRLITMEKVGSGAAALEGLDRGIKRVGSEGVRETMEAGGKKPGHADFGRRFFDRFE